MPKTDASSVQQPDIASSQKYNLTLAKGAAVFFTQPVHVIMRNTQAAVNNKTPLLSAKDTAKILYQNGGMKPFFKGSGMASLKEVGKYWTYKTPLLIKAPDIIDLNLPASLNRLSPSTQIALKFVSAGVFAGVADQVFGGPMEALTTYLATSQGKHSKASMLSELSALPTYPQKIARIYQGSVAATVTSSIAFTTFFAVSNPVNRVVRNLYQIEGDSTPMMAKGAEALLTGGAVALTSAPFDIVKTISQMPAPGKDGIGKTLANNVRHHGVRGLTAGLGLKTGMVVLGWGLNSFFTQHLKTTKDELPEDGVRSMGHHERRMKK